MPTGAKLETSVGEVSWVRTIGTGGEGGGWVMANLRALCAFSEVSSSHPDPVIGAWWEYRSRVARKCRAGFSVKFPNF